MTQEIQKELELLEETIKGIEKVNKVICDAEFKLPSASWSQDTISTPAFIRQRLYGLRVDLGQIHQYVKMEVLKLQAETRAGEDRDES